MKELLYRYNPWWEGEIDLKNSISRPIFFQEMLDNLRKRQIVILTGLRRVGKTTLMKQLIRHLLDEKNIKAEHIFYISLDDYLLKDKSILEIVEEYRKIHRLAHDKKVFLFLDEITYQKDFEIQLKNIYDQENAKVYVSSSSASVLKSKKSFLTGRNSLIEIMPLNFKEYLQFKKIKIKKADKHLLEGIFEEFMQTGGMPEYVLTGDVQYLKELVDDIIQKDIAAHYGIRDVQILKDYFLLLMERSGKVLSINKIAKILDISPDSSRRYLDMFVDSYLIFLVSRHGKVNERLLSAKKIYAADLGIKTYFSGFRDKGSLFENYVYLQIKKNNPAYIYQDGNEIDFMTDKKILIEVKYNAQMNEKQNKLFEKIVAKKKILIKNIFDLDKLK
ncbi:MAG: ATP-binding protein [Parcubacteria group bacterium]|jgi:hypothetical protein